MTVDPVRCTDVLDPRSPRRAQTCATARTGKSDNGLSRHGLLLAQPPVCPAAREERAEFIGLASTTRLTSFGCA
jgi:hypothetical protein